MSGYVGRMLLYNPFLKEMEFNQFDEDYRNKCCDPDIYTDALCKEYFDRRPISTDEGFSSPVMGK